MARITRIILWFARIWGALVLAFVLVFLFGDLLKGSGGGSPSISFILMPIGLVVGLGLAFKWEGLGGLIATLSMIGAFVLRPDLIGNRFLIAFTVPGLLYLIYWVMANRRPSPSPSGT
jgi:hypothetical protein